VIESFSQVIFGIINMIMRLAPIGAFGAMAFTIGKYGVGTLVQLGQLIICFYITCILFVVVVLGSIARATGFNIFKFIRYIREELLIVLGTSSSESALPRMLDKMEKLGCRKSVVGLVIPTGYSFNLDGTSIYLTMAAVFIAQATNSHMDIFHQITLLVVLLLSSKGAAGVTGSGFIVLAATISAVGHLPVAGLALILGIDRFMSEARALTNLVGNGVATVVVAKWVKELDHKKLDDTLNNRQLTAKLLVYPLNLVTNARIPLSGCGLLRIITVHTCHNSTRFFGYISLLTVTFCRTRGLIDVFSSSSFRVKRVARHSF
jgi:aerobic C4-dicarboxylate transport protein